MTKTQSSQLVGITEITQRYIPVSKKKATAFVKRYLEPKRIGNQLFVNREKLEALLNDSNNILFPLSI